MLKEARNLAQPSSTITYLISPSDANAAVKCRFLNQPSMKPLITYFDFSRDIMTKLARLRTNHFEGIKNIPDGAYIFFKNCPIT